MTSQHHGRWSGLVAIMADRYGPIVPHPDPEKERLLAEHGVRLRKDHAAECTHPAEDVNSGPVNAPQPAFTTLPIPLVPSEYVDNLASALRDAGAAIHAAAAPLREAAEVHYPEPNPPSRRGFWSDLWQALTRRSA